MNISETSALDQYQLDTSPTPKLNKELGQDDFLELMTQQLKNQDPMKPMDNGEFLGQMAQFSTVSGIESMQASLESLTQTFSSSQTLQSVQLVGQEVLIENPDLSLDSSGGTGGRFDLDATSGDVQLNISDSAGNLVRKIDLGEFAAGRHDFIWNGQNTKGDRVPAGNYTADIVAKSGEIFNSATVLSARIIDSVEFGKGGESTLNTTQGDVLSLADIRQIRNVVNAQSNN
jgi:flagellar basal-body rod modification protein FlgD